MEKRMDRRRKVLGKRSQCKDTKRDKGQVKGP